MRFYGSLGVILALAILKAESNKILLFHSLGLNSYFVTFAQAGA